MTETVQDTPPLPQDRTPEEWLPVLAGRLDKRRPKIKERRNYTDGNAPLPEMGPNLRQAWARWQKKSRTNYGGLACEKVNERLRPLGVAVSADPIAAGGADTTVAAAASAAAERIFRDNRVRSQFKQATLDMLATRYGYVLVSVGEDRKALISRRKPEDFIAAPEPLAPWKARAYLSVWHDPDERREYAYVGAMGRGQLFWRSDKNLSGQARTNIKSNDWQKSGSEDTYQGRPKVAILTRMNGLALVEPHYDLIDRINYGKLQRLVITAMQAFRQRALETDEELEREDEDGNAINWANTFEPAPGALWELPPNVKKIWESEQTDITPLLSGEKADAQEFAAITRLPIAAFTPEGANQSATGADATMDGLYSQANDELDNIGPALDMVMVHSLMVENIRIGGATVQVQWAAVDRITMAEKYTAATQAKAAGLSRETILRDVLGMSPAEIRKDTAALASDQLALSLLMSSANAAGLPADADEQTVKDRADALGVLIRSGADPVAAAAQVGFEGLEFTGAVPVSLRPKKDEAAVLEEK